jgi:hypothetical protein
MTEGIEFSYKHRLRMRYTISENALAGKLGSFGDIRRKADFATVFS